MRDRFRSRAGFIANLVGLLLILITLAGLVFTYERVSDYVQAESVQRVHTIGERCESQQHSADEHGPQEAWFLWAHGRCKVSLAKVEARAGVHYKP